MDAENLEPLDSSRRSTGMSPIEVWIVIIRGVHLLVIVGTKFRNDFFCSRGKGRRYSAGIDRRSRDAFAVSRPLPLVGASVDKKGLLKLIVAAAVGRPASRCTHTNLRVGLRQCVPSLINRQAQAQNMLHRQGLDAQCLVLLSDPVI
jgi:hypothetical protein